MSTPTVWRMLETFTLTSPAYVYAGDPAWAYLSRIVIIPAGDWEWWVKGDANPNSNGVYEVRIAQAGSDNPNDTPEWNFSDPYGNLTRKYTAEDGSVIVRVDTLEVETGTIGWVIRPQDTDPNEVSSVYHRAAYEMPDVLFDLDFSDGPLENGLLYASNTIDSLTPVMAREVGKFFVEIRARYAASKKPITPSEFLNLVPGAFLNDYADITANQEYWTNHAVLAETFSLEEMSRRAPVPLVITPKGRLVLVTEKRTYPANQHGPASTHESLIMFIMPNIHRLALNLNMEGWWGKTTRMGYARHCTPEFLSILTSRYGYLDSNVNASETMLNLENIWEALTDKEAVCRNVTVLASYDGDGISSSRNVDVDIVAYDLQVNL